MKSPFTSGERRGALLLAALLAVISAVMLLTHGFFSAKAPVVVVNEQKTVRNAEATDSVASSRSKKSHGRKKKIDRSLRRHAAPERDPLNEPV